MVLNLSENRKRLLLVLIKVLALGIIGFLLYFKLSDQQDLFKSLYSRIVGSVWQFWHLYLLVVILMALNWSIEALKWKVLVAKFMSISFSSSLGGVLSGLTLSFVTPHGIGDYFGRIVSIDKKGREKLVGSLLLGRISQMLATVLFGFIGLGHMYGILWIVAGLVLACFSMVLCFKLIAWLSTTSIFEKYLKAISMYGLNELVHVQLLSLMRYAVFSIQFLVVLYIFLPGLDLMIGFAGTTFIFLFKSILPTINFLSDLGIREYSAVIFFEKFDIDTVSVVCASLSIWLINILVPTVIGIPFMLKLKWRS